ncbi:MULTISPECIES: DsbA family oxidoreductase [Henriciella]|jgi:predicted DsbA family dithiol-disulfide isomerase|uniref:DSBA oxidoreductase n=1 Tax=Henriciella pelagia TaxID=1977912 RepID=A0ABQ1J5M9_9PROT|nr:DsbA family oxidoreductase [Henriciella pelagia]GGB60592.1 DSBA oxidoreductase [Henriciella pelagia]
MSKLTIEMVSDLVCPWCWLGLRRIREAIDLVPEIEVELLFRPFELDPTIPEGGVNYRDYMAKKFGPETEDSRWASMRQALIEYGESEGIPYRFNDLKHRPNSFNAHRLVRWAQGQGKGAEAKEALFSAYFEHARDIGNEDVLADIGEEIGLERDIVEKLLASDADVDETRKEEELFRQMGIGGVPTYIAMRRVAVQGAESAEKLAKFIRASAAQLPQQRGYG